MFLPFPFRRNAQDHNLPPSQQSTAGPDNIKQEVDTNTKPKVRINVKKKNQLKKLEEITTKFKERSEKIVTETKKLADVSEKCVRGPKSLIPIPHKKKMKAAHNLLPSINLNENEDGELISNSSHIIINSSEVGVLTDKLNFNDKLPLHTPKNVTPKKPKGSTISLDSLEDPYINTKKETYSQSVGINTELLCPCVPCVIHDTSSVKVKTNKVKSSKRPQTKICKLNNSKINSNFDENIDPLPKPTVELLYKNLNTVSSSDITDKILEENNITCNEDKIELNSMPALERNYLDNKLDIVENSNYTEDTELNDSIKDENMFSRNQLNQQNEVVDNVDNENNSIAENDNDLSGENFKDNNYEHDLSEDNFEDDSKIDEIEVTRHGSGDTYTKFIDNPEDLEEFLALTDEIITDYTEKNALTDNEIHTLHTPKTISIESMNNDGKLVEDKHNFSQTFEELKNNFKELMQEANVDQSHDCVDDPKNVCDMEHITVYELKFYEQSINKDNTIPKNVPSQKDSDLKLPSIKENNKSTKILSRSKNKTTNNKESYKCKMQVRSDKQYQTYIIKEPVQESSDEAPPLKLPRIDFKRFFLTNIRIIITS
ncbi:repetitive organellar protein-like [Leptidea sinapis]|uniref:repetitive organellar protein-like n=1 Tax=Leptidea sinapis TaxID=189913 RepID=UPI0021C4450C|nr:repetitive organellar protein-like [Leptidea sinapis]